MDLLRVVFLVAFLTPLLRCLYYCAINNGCEIFQSITERIKEILFQNGQIITDINKIENRNEIGRDKTNRRG